MPSRLSYYGGGLVDRNDVPPKRRRMILLPKRALAAIAIVILMGIAGMSIAFHPSGASVPAHSEGQTTIAVALLDQHKDTMMPDSFALCGNPGPCPPHLPNDVKNRPIAGGDNAYGTFDDCPHCSAYCAPASIAMIATYLGIAIPFNQQDDIYDNGKNPLSGEIRGNGNIETHGIGMTDGTGGSAWEVQDAFNYSIGVGNWVQYNQSGPGFPALTAAQLKQYIATGHPVLWLDHGGQPNNISDWAIEPSLQAVLGHAKVIAGYDDNDTLGTVMDDLCLIYDPWPEYNDKGFLPYTNATKGPGNTFDPYWLPLRDVNLTDPTDKYLVDTTVIPEFSTVLIPILGVSIIAMIALRKSARRDSEE